MVYSMSEKKRRKDERGVIMDQASMVILGVMALFAVARIAVAITNERDGYVPEKKSKNDKEEYVAIIRKLPKDIVQKLYSSFQEAAVKIGTVVSPGDYPDKYIEMFMATKTVMDEGVYGNITGEQRERMKEVLNDLNWIIKEYIPAANQANVNLRNSDGLGFDLITNSAADAMLYSAMNARSKVKGNDKRIMEYCRLVDNQFIGIIEKIKEIV